MRHPVAGNLHVDKSFGEILKTFKYILNQIDMAKYGSG
jgi:hypothetical protein